MRGFTAKCSDGRVYNELDLATKTEPGLIVFKKLLKERNLKIESFQLTFDNQTVFTANNSKVYFYAKRIRAWFGTNTTEQIQEYGIGNENRNGFVEICWYDGNDSNIEERKINSEDIGIILNG